jgi:hypothetical protein
MFLVLVRLNSQTQNKRFLVILKSRDKIAGS